MAKTMTDDLAKSVTALLRQAANMIEAGNHNGGLDLAERVVDIGTLAELAAATGGCADPMCTVCKPAAG